MKTSKLIFSVLFVCALVVLITQPAFTVRPQEPVTVNVTDGSSNPVSGATVRLCNGFSTYSQTSSFGVAYFPDVAAGSYCLDAATSTLMGRDDDEVVGKAGATLYITIGTSEVPMCSNCP